MEPQVFKQCGSCKKPIALMQKYYACNISGCKKTAYCSMHCFDAHSPVFRHKDAWAEEKFAPKALEPEPQAPLRAVAKPSSDAPVDILIVASKLKDYVRAKSGMNTSASVLERLSSMVRLHCDAAAFSCPGLRRRSMPR